MLGFPRLRGYHTLYVTRPDGDKYVSRLGVGNAWLAASMLVVQSNILGWGLYGLYALGDKII